MTYIPKMPDPWFQVNVLSKSIGEVVRADTEHLRPLKPDERLLGNFILPPFQRPAVWTREQQTRLIESIWDGMPIGAYVWNQTDYHHATDGWLLDGQQRITAIFAYVAGEFPVYGHRYPDLHVSERRGFQYRPIGAIQTRIMSETYCREVYDRLAYGGTAHEVLA